MDIDNQDRRRTVMVKGRQVTFNLLSFNSSAPQLEKVTSVAVVAFDEAENIIAVCLKDRGVDLPGGHMQTGEKTFEETARREAMEEACILLDTLTLACIISSDYFGSKPDDLTYMVIMTGSVAGFEPLRFAHDEQSLGRKVMPITEFLDKYEAGDKGMMRDIITQAHTIYRQTLEKNVKNSIGRNQGLPLPKPR